MCILLVGMPRSGTTWAAKILDSHPNTLYRHEPDSGPALRAVPLLAGPDSVEEHGGHLRAFVSGLPTDRNPRLCGKLPLFPKRYLPGWRFTAFKTSIYLAKAARGRLPIPVLQPATSRAPQPRLVWKSIESTGRAGLFAASIPDMHVIHLLRHPCGQIASVLRGEAARQFGDECASSDDWGIFELLLATPQARRYGLTMEQLQGLDPISRLAWRWVLFNEKAMEEFAEHPKSKLVRYEDLCRDPAQTARAIFDFTGLSWEPCVEDFLRDSSTSGSDSYYGVYRRANREAERWRERLDAEVIDRIRAVVSDTLPGRQYEASW